MDYRTNVPGGGVTVTFYHSEVNTVRRVFEENAKRLRALGNDSSISAYQRRIIGWTGTKQTFAGANSSQLVEPLRYFIESTEDRVDELLDACSQATRKKEAANRYKLGYDASVILAEIEQMESGEAIGSVD